MRRQLEDSGALRESVSGFVTWLSRNVRDVPLARAAAIRLLAARRGTGAADGVLFLFYHDMRASERRRFETQLDQLRDFGDLVSLEAAMLLLADGRAGGRHICLTFDDGYRGAFEHAFPILASRGVPAAFFIVPGWLDEARPGVIDWSECRRLAKGGMEVGSHSRTHRRLAALSSAEVEEEFAASRARIEAELGRPCLHFACPWGQPGADYRPERDPGLARAAGFRSFLTTIPHRATPGSDPWAVPRVRMEPGWGSAELRYAFSRP